MSETPASPNQRRCIRSLSYDLGIPYDLDGQLRVRYGVGLDGLTMAQASETIDRMRADLDALTVEGFRKRGVAID